MAPTVLRVLAHESAPIVRFVVNELLYNYQVIHFDIIHWLNFSENVTNNNHFNLNFVQYFITNVSIQVEFITLRCNDQKGFYHFYRVFEKKT